MMDIPANVALLAGLSMAAERLVEIFRGYFFVGFPAATPATARDEALRTAKIDTLAIIAGIVTAVFAKIVNVLVFEWWEVAVFGVLAGAGSGFWNTVLTYMLQVKNLKKEEVLSARRLPPP
jgi:hypothetical protein